jgi:flagellar M-ring protein FliF
VLVILLLVVFVLRPTMKRLTAQPADELLAESDQARDMALPGPDGDEDEDAGGLVLERDEEFIKLPGPAEYESLLDAARQLVDEDPKRVVQLMKTWIEDDAA